MQSNRKDIRVCIPYEGLKKSLIYISFLPDGGVSIGLNDKTFRVLPRLRVGGDSLDSRDEVIDLERECGVSELVNPHYSLHNGYFHLKSSKGTVLYRGLVWTKPFPGEEISPWIRLRTNPISTLKEFSRAQNGNSAHVILLEEPPDDCSVQFHFDFASDGSNVVTGGKQIANTFAWSDFFLRVTALQLPPTNSALGSFVKG